MSSPILVIGALGNVGAEVVRHLQAKGQAVRAADIDPLKVKERFGLEEEAVHFDFTNPRTFEAAFKGVEKMFLMRPPHIGNTRRDMFPAIDAAKRGGVRQVVFLSLIGIEDLKFVPHYKVERHLKDLQFDTTFLRCSFFMQNLSTIHRREIRDRSEIFVPASRAKTSFIDVRDIGEAASVVLTGNGHANRNYDLTGSEALDYWQAAKILSEILGREILYRNPSPFQFLLETMKRGTPFPFAVVQLGLHTSTRFGMAKEVTNDAENLLGRKPITFRQFVMDHREVWGVVPGADYN